MSTMISKCLFEQGEYVLGELGGMPMVAEIGDQLLLTIDMTFPLADVPSRHLQLGFSA